jgi:hypothetical protein
MLVSQMLMVVSLFAAQDLEHAKVFVDLPVLKVDLANQGELNEKWKLFLVQDLLQQRMADLCTPYMTKEELRTCLQGQIERLRVEGFSKEEFYAAQEHWTTRLLALEETSSDLDTSLAVLHSLKHEELFDCIHRYLETNGIRVLSSESTAPLRCSLPQKGHSSPAETQPASEVDAYYELSLPDHERKLIHELVRNMAEKSIWGLLFKKREMERLGKRVNHVHPMRFIGYILAEPRLKRYLKEVSTSSFKWDHFIDGFSKRMKEETARDNVMRYIPGMAHSLKFDPARMAAFIHDKDYDGLVQAILAQR